jgi:phosphoglycerate dehydrogenase-like enzyme
MVIWENALLKLRGFEVEVLCYIKEHVGDANAKQVSLKELQQKADVLSLHIPWTRKLIKWLMRLCRCFRSLFGV